MEPSSLEKFNEDNILGHILAIEEHSLNAGAINISTWCKKKHFFQGRYHNLNEYRQLNSNNPDKLEKLNQFDEKWQKMMDDNATALEWRNLRNEWREIINDPTLSQSKKSCGVCALDRRAGSQSVEDNAEATAFIQQDTTQTNSSTPLWIIGGILVVGLLILANKK